MTVFFLTFFIYSIYLETCLNGYCVLDILALDFIYFEKGILQNMTHVSNFIYVSHCLH